ncbi:MAG: mechanosensitive ion channel family protein [Bacteroidota bacterium]|nr:mechanosensitive ion channel family protein [Bacteroidota bacterium]
MKQQARIKIPGRYFVKLLIEVCLISFALFIYSISHNWLDDLGRLGPTFLVVLRFAIFLFGIGILVRLLAMIYRHRKHLPYNRKDNVTLGLSNISIMVITVYAFISAFQLIGLSPEKIFTSLSIVAAAFAILSKDFFADIISGIVISFSKEITIDDYVKIGEYRGKIIDINIAKIALLNEDDDILFMPNSTVFTSDIINYTKKQIKKTSIDFEIPTSSVSSIEELEEQLMISLSEYHHLIEPNSYSIRVVQIRKDFLVLKFQYSLIQFSRDMERNIKRKATRYIVRNITQSRIKESVKSEN